MKIEIAKESDRFLWIKIVKSQGLFSFNETNLSNVTCVLYDKNETQIATYSQSGSTLVPVVISEDSNGNLQSSASTATNIFELMLVGSTTSGKETGFIKAKVILTWSNTDLPDDTYDVTIPTFNTDYYLIPTL